MLWLCQMILTDLKQDIIEKKTLPKKVMLKKKETFLIIFHKNL